MWWRVARKLGLLGLGLTLVSDVALGQGVYVNAKVRVPEHMALGKLRSIFTMHQRQWDDGATIKVFVLPDDHPLHRDFARDLLKVFPYRLRQQWDRLTFSGTGTAPVTVSDLDEMRQALRREPNSIGYLEGEEAVAGLKHIVAE